MFLFHYFTLICGRLLSLRGNFGSSCGSFMFFQILLCLFVVVLH